MSSLSTATKSFNVNNEKMSPKNAERERSSLEPAYKPSARRWPTLVIFAMLSASNAYQWPQFSILADVVGDYYRVSPLAVYWTSMVYMVPYVPLILPATWLLETRGLRFVVLLGAFGNCLGSIVKCFSARRDLFWLSFIGQSITGVSQLCILNIPAKLGAVWFGAAEVSTAVAAGVFGNQLGMAAGFLLPPMLVPWCNQTESLACVEHIGRDLLAMFLSSAIFATAILVLLVLFFQERPKMPPSLSQAKLTDLVVDGASISAAYWGELKALAKDRNFLLLTVTYGINVGEYYAVGTVLNTIVLAFFPGEQLNAGRMGLAILLAGLVGSMLCGMILDRTKAFKATTLALFVFSFLSLLFFAWMLERRSLFMVFVAASALGFFMTGYIPVGFEFAVEQTYPIGEGTSSGILNASAQVFGTSLIIGLNWVIARWGVTIGNGMMAALLLIGCMLTALIRSDLKRLNAGTSTKEMMEANSCR